MLAKNETTPHKRTDPCGGEVAIAGESLVGHDAEQPGQCLNLPQNLHCAANGGLGQTDLRSCGPQRGVGAALTAGFHVDIQSGHKGRMGHIELQQLSGNQGVAAGELGALDLIGVAGIYRPGESLAVSEAANLMDKSPLLKLLQRLLHRCGAAVRQSCQLLDRLSDGAVSAAMGQHGEEYALGTGVQLGIGDDMVGHAGEALLPHQVLSFLKLLVF